MKQLPLVATILLIACTLLSSSILGFTLSLRQTNIPTINDISSYNTTANITENMIKAIDAGVTEMVQTASWRKLFSDLNLPFNIPQCVKAVTSYPLSNPFVGIDTLNVCYERPTDPWLEIYKQGGDMLVAILNTKYVINLKTKHYFLNTTLLGYFETMRKGVDSGFCHIITSAAINTAERAAKVHFNCPSGTSSLAFLRSELDNTNSTPLFNTVKTLNDSRAIIAVFGGAYFESQARAFFSAARLIVVNGGFADIWPYILTKQVHAMIGDAVDVSSWLNSNKNQCQRCFVSIMGDPYDFSSFTTMNYLKNSAHQRTAWNLSFMVLVAALNVLIVSIIM
ncbi:hypothetical protein FDP41_012477 [Naegleria fowleri]|uniref:Uncharacterized protein n=1 Tax=Naegleria fowleri TaxID=5763 RepID=A0A6A5C7Q5_NAEFO|nr:uncharacterized protein FDP41_012477 [Naegleria fowleri]KAF0981820.1 hypothetical protein FDP41_012477 [Naegleria fowleri]CAG4713662.1 unnamed protein product [Naegleria fowleri]